LGSGIPAKKSLFRKITMEMANRADLPKVLDAGALYLTGTSKSPTIITPHAGELAQMLSVTSAKIDADPIKFALNAANKFKVTVLLKGHQTVITNGDRVIRMPEANSYLATSGTGDVLAGILAALVALNHELVTAENLIEIGATASLIHSQLITSGPVSPTEMISNIPGVISKLSA
jgi:hydroxyethylthiazole kinase-like uncharacterized protein yjeF